MGGGRERLLTGAEKEARRRLLLVVQQVISLGWLFYSSEIVYNLSDAPPQWSGSGWSVGSAGRWGRKGHTDPDMGDGPQAARRPESRREPVLALQVRWTAPAMHGGADGLTLPAASGRRGPCTSIFQSSHTGFEWAA